MTLFYPRTKIKDSHYFLGSQRIWARLGRQIIQNLTTVTASERDFKTLLLRLYPAEKKAIKQHKANEIDFSQVFLKIDQLVSYRRVTGKNSIATSRSYESEIPGICRVRRNLQENSGKMRFLAHLDDQILSNQQSMVYGCLYRYRSQWCSKQCHKYTSTEAKLGFSHIQKPLH